MKKAFPTYAPERTVPLPKPAPLSFEDQVGAVCLTLAKCPDLQMVLLPALNAELQRRTPIRRFWAKAWQRFEDINTQ